MVGIIGLPYAFNRAGLVLGIVLLFVLTGIVDWTIRYQCLGLWEVDFRLIVVNAKLSGSSSYQDTVAACFGHGGLVFTLVVRLN
jgi:sodium-coupled neutral amino acid transporter 11